VNLLDTDTLSLLFAGHPRVSQHVRRATDEVATTIITRIEILEGRFASLLKAEDGGGLLRRQERLLQSERNLSTLPILALDASAAGEFDRLRLNKRLKKIGRRDLLIASSALAHRATLVTRNRRHFQQVPGLKVENWAD